jgi:hypothetical protein
MDDEHLQCRELVVHSAQLKMAEENFSFGALLDLPHSDPLNTDDQNQQYRDTAPKRHTTGTNAYGWTTNSQFPDNYPTRKAAIHDVREKTLLSYKQSSTSKSSSTVIYRCTSHVGCSASVRVRCTDARFLVEFSTDPHADVLVEQTRGVPLEWLPTVDRLIRTHKGQPQMVFNEIMTEFWDGTDEDRHRFPPKSAIVHRAKYLNQLKKTDTSVSTVAEAREFAESMRCPSTKEEIEKLPPTQAYCVYFAHDEQYGCVFVLCHNVWGDNMLEEANQHDLDAGTYYFHCVSFRRLLRTFHAVLHIKRVWLLCTSCTQ